MQHEKLITTHRKLTFLFTALVFCIVCVLGFSTLFAKFYNESRIQKGEFRKSSEEIQKILESENIVLQNFFLNQIVQKRRFEERLGDKKMGPRTQLSFFILDENKDVVFENIVESVDFEGVEIHEDGEIYRENGFFYKAISIKSQYGSFVVFYDDVKYDIPDILRDMFVLFSMIFLFSSLFYFLGSRFVERALKPVEENLQDMQDFIHNAGHELKTPLAVMRGNLQIMQAEENLDIKLVKQSIREVDHMNTLIESLRELAEVGVFSKKEHLAISVEVRKVVEELHQFAQEKQVNCENLVKGDYIVHANRGELRVVLSNILQNAIKYNTPGGSVIVDFHKNVLSIQDTGRGIAKENQEKIFERFFQESHIRSEEGFGIGLSLVKKIADANRWKISVESQVGQGTTFKITF